MKKYNYKYTKVSELTAEEASHMYTWILVKSFFLISIILIFVVSWISLCAYLYMSPKIKAYEQFTNKQIEEFHTEKSLSNSSDLELIMNKYLSE